MNLKEIEYIVTLAEEGKLARAAQRLFITPSALTQQVSNLEHEIGLPLFERSRSGWSPTRAGQIYLSSARQILQIRQETDRRLQDLSDSQKGNLSIGVTSEHGTTTFTHIYPAFHKQFPEVTINIYEANVRTQQQMICTGKLDLGILTLSEEQQTEDLYIPLAQEEILLAIPSLHPACGKAVPTEKSPYPELDPNLVRYEPFAMMYKESTMYEVICQAFRIYGFYPETLFFAQRFCHNTGKWCLPGSAAASFQAILLPAAIRMFLNMFPTFPFPHIRSGISVPAGKREAISQQQQTVSSGCPRNTGESLSCESFLLSFSFRV